MAPVMNSVSRSNLTPVGGSSDPLAGVTSDPASFLSQGASGPGVAELQTLLKKAGFDPHSGTPADGKFGAQTLQALEAFQKSKGLAADGVVGPQTKAALCGAPGRSSLPKVGGTAAPASSDFAPRASRPVSITGAFRAVQRAAPAIDDALAKQISAARTAVNAGGTAATKTPTPTATRTAATPPPPTGNVTATAATATTAATGNAPKLADVKVTEKSTREYGPTPWVWNQWLPKNGGRDSAEYKHWHAMHDAAAGVTTAKGQLAQATLAEGKANTALATAQKALTDAGSDPKKLASAKAALAGANRALTAATDAKTRATAALTKAEGEVASTSKDFKTFLKSQLPDIETRDPELKTRSSALHAAEKALTAAKGKKPLDQASIDTAQAAVDGAKQKVSERKKALADEVDAYQPVQEYDKKTQTVEIDGQTLTFTDHAQTYATEKAGGLSGSAGDGGQKGTDEAIDATSLSKNDKLIMKQISRQEGHLSTTESYDIGGVTWGMLQWTTGMKGDGSIIKVLDKVKSEHPDAFKKCFQDYGLDVSNGVLQVTRTDGTVLTGAAAVEAVRTEPKLSAALAAAATNADVKAAQIAAAKSEKIDHDGLDRGAAVKVNGKDYKFSAKQIFTSAWGAALVVNAGVHAGPGAVSARLKEGLEAFFKANPKVDPSKPETWAAQAEAFMAKTMIAGDTGRADAFAAAGLSKAPGSY